MSEGIFPSTANVRDTTLISNVRGYFSSNHQCLFFTDCQCEWALLHWPGMYDSSSLPTTNRRRHCTDQQYKGALIRWWSSLVTTNTRGHVSSAHQCKGALLQLTSNVRGPFSHWPWGIDRKKGQWRSKFSQHLFTAPTQQLASANRSVVGIVNVHTKPGISSYRFTSFSVNAVHVFCCGFYYSWYNCSIG